MVPYLEPPPVTMRTQPLPTPVFHTHFHKDRSITCYRKVFCHLYLTLGALLCPTTHTNWEMANELCPRSVFECEDPCRHRCNEARDICRAPLSLDSILLARTYTFTRALRTSEACCEL
ncbi:hypothetical protein ILYODFUR_036071 [Ilyodon furcidens]|uniref:Uncharacterized protein n=1 Tax=Ilyodon furcidens TaxID=33524 RepID=A0ABV0TQX4_9TELE